jgi:hypothetical protein
MCVQNTGMRLTQEAEIHAMISSVEQDSPIKDDIGSVRRGLRFLCSAQEPDGRFIDFALPPGPGDSWITGFVTVALDEAQKGPTGSPEIGTRAAVAAAVEALLRSMRREGWGYNQAAPPDGDSTAFALRAILRGKKRPPLAAEVMLAPYLEGEGLRRPDLVASMGLALCEAQAPAPLRARVLSAVVLAQRPNGTWASSRWRRPFYPTWLVLSLLRAERALDVDLARAAQAGLLEEVRKGEDLCVLDVACLVGALTDVAEATGGTGPRGSLRRLLDMQEPDGGWPASRCLVPGTGGDGGAAYADIRRLFTTAVAVQAAAHALGRQP